MIYTQLVYGIVVATNLLGGTSMFNGGPPLAKSAANACEIFEAVNERAAAIGYKLDHPPYDDHSRFPFAYSETNRVGYEFIDAPYFFSGWDSGNAYWVTNGSWKAWSFNAFAYPTFWDFFPFHPFVGFSTSSFQYQQAARAIDRICPYYVRGYTETNVTMWTPSDLWTAAGAITNENPFPGSSEDTFYQHIGTNRLWILNRALTNLTMTRHISYYMPYTATNIEQIYFSGTNVAAIKLGPVYSQPSWVATNNLGDPILNLTNGGYNVTNTVTGFAPTYGGPTAATDGYSETITFAGYPDWYFYYSSAPEYWAQVSNKVTVATKRTRAYYHRVPQMGHGVTSSIDVAFCASMDTNSFLSTNALYFWTNTFVSAPVTHTGVGTNWLDASMVVTAIVPEVGSVIDLTAFSKTNEWDSQGRQIGGSPVIQVDVMLTRPRYPVVLWNFTRCKP